MLTAIGFDRVDGGAGLADRDIDGWMLTAVARGDKPVRDRPSVSERTPRPFARHSSISLFQTPDSTPFDGGASVTD